jgi:membrane-associated phospholipid phosphatase
MQVQSWLLPRRSLIRALGGAYVSLNILVTVGWMGALYHRGDDSYHELRRALALATLGAQPFFLAFPCAPPRLDGALLDTVRELNGLDLDRGLVSHLYDPVGAMPSIHTAFATVAGVGGARTARSAPGRAVACAYPGLVALTVVATANHYVLDVAAGAALALGALRLSAALER